MKVVSKYPDGVFSWVDLGTIDVNSAKSFYGGLFGWDFVDLETDMGTIYSMAQIEGYNVAGIGPLSSDMREQGVTSLWSAYINSRDVDSAARLAAQAGGLVLFPPFDVMDSGRMSMIQDPTGAVFGVWQPAAHIGAQLVNVPNTLVWNELQTPDVDAARTFYGTVFAWTYDVDKNGYVTCKAEGRTQAGMMKIEGEMSDIPPNWATYFLVDDIEVAAGKVPRLGGEVHVPPSPAGEIGKIAVIQDPQGGFFNLIEYAFPAAPPPGY